ncbi:MAG: recombination protein O N-terminal domain-containing protein, partial [Bacteroidales bacterium]|nr:recombination protein O N-terminal domain-containing protein [Bacteroidales bacterium]
MIHPTKGILLHRLKYSDSKLILNILTREFGLQSYLFFVSVSAKKKSILNLLQPMYLLDLQVYHKENTGLQKIKDISAGKVLINLPFDIYKQTISLFLAEFLLKMLRENQTDKELFDFIYNSVISLDDETEHFNNFHIFFLYRLTEFLGVKPENNYSDSKKIF